MTNMRCGFVGLGLIGGSIAKAIKQANSSCTITAFDISEKTRELALSQGIADHVTDRIDSSFGDCDIIFLCAPVQKNDENLLQIKNFMKPGCILTDVGSVKSSIHEAVHEAGLDSVFIGGHPMAGSERVGFVNSKASILENAYYILTPTETASPRDVAFYKELVEKMGAIPLVLDYKTHDYVTAAVSHLPHVIAATLVNLVRDSDSTDGIMKMIAAGGFKDITRIASSSAAMWQQICLTNTANISELLSHYIDSLNRIRVELDQKKQDELYELFDSARIYRDSFINASSGPIKKSYSFNVDIADKTGALAHIATLLAVNNLSIKNIGISHNRESEDGVLRIEMYDEESMNKAMQILKSYAYTIYEKG